MAGANLRITEIFLWFLFSYFCETKVFNFDLKVCT